MEHNNYERELKYLLNDDNELSFDRVLDFLFFINML